MSLAWLLVLGCLALGLPAGALAASEPVMEASRCRYPLSLENIWDSAQNYQL